MFRSAHQTPAPGCVFRAAVRIILIRVARAAIVTINILNDCNQTRRVFTFMPIYEYTCQKCQAQIEIMQKLSDQPLKRHSECGGKLEKQWSQTSFQLKGAGWYVTDYAAKKTEGKEKDGGEKPEAKEATDGTETKDVKEAKDGKGDAVSPAAATTPQADAGPQKSSARKTTKKAPSGKSGGD